MNAEFLLEVADEDIHRRHMERVAANEQRMERQRKAQTFVLHAAGGMGIDRLVGAQQGKGRQNLDQIGQAVHRSSAQIFKAEPIAPFAVVQELVIARQIPRREPRHLGPHCLGRLARGEAGPVLPTNLIKRIERPQIDIAVKIAPAGRPQFPQSLWHRHNRRPQIKAVPTLGNGTAATTRHIQPVDHRHLITLGSKPHGRR